MEYNDNGLGAEKENGKHIGAQRGERMQKKVKTG